MRLRPTFAQIDLSALKHNYNRVLRSLPKNCGVLAVVKADAYGHGAVTVAKALEGLGTAGLGVATVEEGVELRQAKVAAKVLILQGLLGMGEAAAKVLLEHKLTPVIHNVSTLSLWNSLGGSRDRRLPVHLKLDTGMTRLGVTSKGLALLLETLQKCPALKLEGVMTHLAFREDEKYTRHQLKLFNEMGEQIQKIFGKVPVGHIANSAAVMNGSPVTMDWAEKCWARPGIMLYGIPPYPAYAGKGDLEPVMRLVSQIALTKNVPAGTKVSYNCTFTTTRPTRIGVVPIGYADGYPFSASGKAKVLVEGKRLPVLGRVTMDLIMIDLTDLPAAQVGSEVVLIGKQKQAAITADELAEWSGTIAYEIVTRVSKRIPRIYS
ncbi:MAG: alanine racemase [Deltaproteobacteria bacterium]|nr:alanine racemase [Deltaproteobacteria bacterium]MBI4224595.1 alanine racemase [Deltaproteobacteria bacterium]